MTLIDTAETCCDGRSEQLVAMSRMAIMAYCPLGQGRLIDNPGLALIAKKHNVTKAAIALAFPMRLPGMI